MRARDYDYIEERLLIAGSDAAEAVPRLRDTGHPDLAQRLTEAIKALRYETRAIRYALDDREGRGR